MFENVIGQKETVRALTSEIADGKLPHACLFLGLPYCGKLTTALEAARVLTCGGGKGDWACECASCRTQRELAHPHTVLLGPRYFDVEIAACADAFLRSPRQSTHFLFIRAVRKLTRRFDTAVWDAEDPRTRGVAEKAAKVEEQLLDLQPEGVRASPRVPGELLEQIVAACAQLAAHARGDAITVGQVRRLSAWAHLTASGSRKVAILENVDRMQESARNALLKLLEEPPEAVFLILLSTRRAAIIPTMLSRLRPYTFAQRSPAEEREVLAKIFRDETPRFASLRSFFLAWKEIDPETLSALAGRFVERVQEPRDASVDILAEMGEMFPRGKSPREKNQKEVVTSFLEELTQRLRGRLRTGPESIETLENWGRAIRDSQTRLEIYNISPQSVIESLFHRMRSFA